MPARRRLPKPADADLDREVGAATSTPSSDTGDTSRCASLAWGPRAREAGPARGAGEASTSGPAAPIADLSDSVDVAWVHATWLLEAGSPRRCLDVTRPALQRDAGHEGLIEAHAAALHALGDKEALFVLGHRLAREVPGRAVTWFVVGTYYLVRGRSKGRCTVRLSFAQRGMAESGALGRPQTCRRWEEARRYFSKATGMPEGQWLASAWLGFGHAFAMGDESDQAMAAYRTAARLFPGLHLPLVGIGTESQRINNLELASPRHACAPCVMRDGDEASAFLP